MEDMVVGWGMVEEEEGKGGKTRFDKVLEGPEESESGVIGSSGDQRRDMELMCQVLSVSSLNRKDWRWKDKGEDRKSVV